MSEVDAHPPDNEEDPPPESEAFDELRRLLLGTEPERLGAVERRLEEHRAEDVSEVLDTAVRKSTAKGDHLAKALTPTIEGALQQSVRRDPKLIADAIAPALGPAIRKSIRQALASMVEGFNQVLESTLSPRGLRWRFEAYRTGRPFSEVALMHSLVYRVEQVLLIHRDDGTVLQHVVAPAVEAQDADMVAGMLSAIRQFAADSFGHGGDAAELAQVEFGDLTLEIAELPRVVLVAAVRGMPPAELRGRLQEQLELAHATSADALADFDGDDTPFEAVRPLLEELLEQQLAEPEKKKRGALLPVLGAIALLVVIVLIARWYTEDARHAQAWGELLIALAEEPGLFVVSSERDGDLFEIVGLRDPLARGPESIAAELELEQRLEWTWTLYQSMDAPVILARVRAGLVPPATVQFSLGADRVLRMSGSAPSAWIESATSRALALGAAGVDAAALVVEDAAE